LAQGVGTGAPTLAVQTFGDAAYSKLLTSMSIQYTAAASSLVFLEISDSGHPILAAQYQDGGFANATRPAKPGDYLTLYLTGLGPKTKSYPMGAAPGADPSVETVRISVEGVAATVTYAGSQPQFPGLDQITFQLPRYSLSPGASTGQVQITATSTGQVVPYRLNLQ
jgi:uncharacterized protein (TIGR03437 family)